MTSFLAFVLVLAAGAGVFLIAVVAMFKIAIAVILLPFNLAFLLAKAVTAIALLPLALLGGVLGLLLLALFAVLLPLAIPLALIALAGAAGWALLR